jgi:hypothetical protein
MTRNKISPPRLINNPKYLKDNFHPKNSIITLSRLVLSNPLLTEPFSNNSKDSFKEKESKSLHQKREDNSNFITIRKNQVLKDPLINRNSFLKGRSS